MGLSNGALNFQAAAQFPFSMAYFAIFALNSEVNLAYGPFVFVELSFFEDSMISLFATEITEEGSSSVSRPVGSGNLACYDIFVAAEITEEGSSSVSGPVESGNLACCSPLRFPTGLKYVKIDLDIAKNCKGCMCNNE